MKKPLRDRIDELAAMDVKALQAEHEKLFGQPAVSTHRQYLFRKIAWQVQAEAQGGLPEAAVEIARGIARLLWMPCGGHHRTIRGVLFPGHHMRCHVLHHDRVHRHHALLSPFPLGDEFRDDACHGIGFRRSGCRVHRGDFLVERRLHRLHAFHHLIVLVHHVLAGFRHPGGHGLLRGCGCSRVISGGLNKRWCSSH
jgi:hypothetical protein